MGFPTRKQKQKQKAGALDFNALERRLGTMKSRLASAKQRINATKAKIANVPAPEPVAPPPPEAAKPSLPFTHERPAAPKPPRRVPPPPPPKPGAAPVEPAKAALPSPRKKFEVTVPAVSPSEGVSLNYNENRPTPTRFNNAPRAVQQVSTPSGTPIRSLANALAEQPVVSPPPKAALPLTHERPLGPKPGAAPKAALPLTHERPLGPKPEAAPKAALPLTHERPLGPKPEEAPAPAAEVAAPKESRVGTRQLGKRFLRKPAHIRVAETETSTGKSISKNQLSNQEIDDLIDSMRARLSSPKSSARVRRASLNEKEAQIFANVSSKYNEPENIDKAINTLNISQESKKKMKRKLQFMFYNTNAPEVNEREQLLNAAGGLRIQSQQGQPILISEDTRLRLLERIQERFPA